MQVKFDDFDTLIRDQINLFKFVESNKFDMHTARFETFFI